jgi:effector-binding domain-containing protein
VSIEETMTDKPSVEVMTVASIPTAVRDARITRAELSATIGELLGDVWGYIRAHGDLEPRHSVVVYRGDPGAGPADIEVGVQVGRRFDGTSPSGIRCSELPAGEVVRAIHRGPYDQMASAYNAIGEWAKAGGHRLSTSWEVYGDWDEDPAKLETEIYFLLAD